MAGKIELNEVELALLREVADNRVCLTRGVYRNTRLGNRPVAGHALQRLRALGLVVLARAGSRIPPTRLCELTEAGRAVLARLN